MPAAYRPAGSPGGPSLGLVRETQGLDVVHDDLGKEIRGRVDLADDRALVEQEHLEHVREWSRRPAARVELDANVLTEAVEQRYQDSRPLGRQEGPLHTIRRRSRRVAAHHVRRVPRGIEA